MATGDGHVVLPNLDVDGVLYRFRDSGLRGSDLLRWVADYADLSTGLVDQTVWVDTDYRHNMRFDAVSLCALLTGVSPIAPWDAQYHGGPVTAPCPGVDELCAIVDRSGGRFYRQDGTHVDAWVAAGDALGVSDDAIEWLSGVDIDARDIHNAASYLWWLEASAREFGDPIPFQRIVRAVASWCLVRSDRAESAVNMTRGLAVAPAPWHDSGEAIPAVVAGAVQASAIRLIGAPK